jgi:hypothetical protein
MVRGPPGAGDVHAGDARGGGLEGARRAIDEEAVLVHVEAEQPRERAETFGRAGGAVDHHQLGVVGAGARPDEGHAERAVHRPDRLRREAAGDEAHALVGELPRAAAQLGDALELAGDQDADPGELRPDAPGELQHLEAGEVAVVVGVRDEEHGPGLAPTHAPDGAAGRTIGVEHPLEGVGRDQPLRAPHLAGDEAGGDHHGADGDGPRGRGRVEVVEADRPEGAGGEAAVAGLAVGAQAGGGIEDRDVGQAADVREADGAGAPEAGREGIGARRRADLGALAAAEAGRRIDAAGTEREVHLEPSGRAADADHLGAREGLDPVVVQHRVEDRLEEAARALAVGEDLVELVRKAAEDEGTLGEDDLAPLAGEGPRGREARRAAADHEDVGGDLDLHGGQRPVERQPRQGRADEPARALGGRGRVAAHPVHLLAQVHHLQQPGGAAGAGEDAAEGDLVLPRGARGDHDPVEALRGDALGEPGLALRRAEHRVRRDVGGGRPGGRLELAEPHHLAEVRAAAAEVEPRAPGPSVGRRSWVPPRRSFLHAFSRPRGLLVLDLDDGLHAVPADGEERLLAPIAERPDVLLEGRAVADDLHHGPGGRLGGLDRELEDGLGAAHARAVDPHHVESHADPPDAVVHGVGTGDPRTRGEISRTI